MAKKKKKTHEPAKERWEELMHNDIKKLCN